MRRHFRAGLIFVLVLPIALSGSQIPSSTQPFADSGKAFSADTIVALLREGVPLQLWACTIKGELEFHETVRTPLVVDNCVFRDRVDFSRTMFCQRVELSGSQFDTMVSFKECKLQECDFSGARFRYRASFENAVFRRIAKQTTARFFFNDPPAYLDFDDAKFLSVISFEGVAPDTTSFLRSVFSGRMALRFQNPEVVYFEPRKISEDGMHSLARATGLRNLRYIDNAAPLAKLRRFFRENGYRQQEREITCALERHDQGILKKMVFDWPFEYGSNLARPFKIVWYYMFPICCAFYNLVFRFRIARGVLVSITLDDDTTVEPKSIRKRIGPYDVSPRGGASYARVWLWREFKMCCVAIFYGFLNTFNLGFRDFDFARWVRIVMPWKLDFQPVGLVRTISGLQAIFSVLLMAFGLLFYFGRFFD
ncbi:MAG TPA: pentapeptide repeat-containing protein [Candidatus Deferrimicrobium sp.]|nr:pentapeptide repeat-containing protein [Candidatus Deferrimicrobium sp.]